MGWQERNYRPRDEGGGFGRAMRRIFVEGDNFFSWALPLFTVIGVRVKVHLLFIIVVAGELLMAGRRSGIGVGYMAASMAALFGIVLLHEFGHVIACRKVGGEADEILLWPLGGLAMCAPPHTWRANLITAIGGPMVNLLLIPVFGAIVFGLTHNWGSVIFSPLEPYKAIFDLRLTQALGGGHPYWLVFLWSLYLTNWVLLLFNVLLPMYPMDGGRIMQSVLWWRLGYGRSMWIATNVGLFGAVVVGVWASLTNQSTLFAIALFGGFTCFDQRRRLKFVEEDEDPILASGRTAYSAGREAQRAPAPPCGPSKREIKDRRREQEHQTEIDRILAKIRASGMGSLTRAEQKTLRGETERKRQE